MKRTQFPDFVADTDELAWLGRFLAYLFDFFGP
jgi:hypothetical protein